MKPLVVLLGAAGMLLLPEVAKASAFLNLDFTGTASANLIGSVFLYSEPSPPNVSFTGQPVTVHLAISDDLGTAYVSHFSIDWSNQTYAFPFITGREADGSPYYGNDSDVTYFSSVDLTDTGGQIRIFGSGGFVAATDGDFLFDLDYALPTAHAPNTAFTDAVTGGGHVDAFVTLNNDPVIGPFDADTVGDFTLSSLTATPVPEPSTWVTMLAGLAGLGLALRRQPGRFGRAA
jgi:hypothetical protein